MQDGHCPSILVFRAALACYQKCPESGKLQFLIISLSTHLLAGWDSDGGLEEVVVLAPQVALQGHLGVRVKVGVGDARPRYAGHEAGLRLPRQVGPLLGRDKVDVVRGVEPRTMFYKSYQVVQNLELDYLIPTGIKLKTKNEPLSFTITV